MKQCALLTCPELEGTIFDEDRLEKALIAKGWSFSWINWQDIQSVDWKTMDCAVIRTTWDYTEEIESFLKNLEYIKNANCRLFNDFELIRWNSDKKYLEELSSKGVSIIPTKWLETPTAKSISESMVQLKTEKVVIKPQCGAGAKNTFVLTKDNPEKIKMASEILQEQKVMLQPFMNKVQEEGEFSVHFFGGEHSHTVLKTPKGNDFRSQEEFGSFVRKVDLSSDQRKFAQSVLDKIDLKCLYARVDFINDDAGQPCLIELELIEPSLYFRYDEEAAMKMVAVLEAMLES